MILLKMNQTDADYILALELQRQFDEGVEDVSTTKCGDLPNFTLSTGTDVFPSKHQQYYDDDYDNLDTSTMSLVDPRWELIDPLPDVRSLFLQFNDKYFWGRLAGIEVKWSQRMTLCAGLCVYEGRGGLCSVRLSQPLLKLRPRKDLIETLLHEMIHAYLFVTDNNKDHDGHGPEFHKHMHRLNKATGTNITVYHTFHDEVDNYRQHWWRCNGPCQTKPPYFGFVKRSMNRAPSPRDPWWPDHQRTCGGSYVKVKEPEGYGVKKKVPKDEIAVKPKNNLDIRMFGGDSTKKTKPSSTVTKPTITSGPSIVNGILKPFNDAAASDKIQSTTKTKNGQKDKLGSREIRPTIHGFGKLYSDSSPKRLQKKIEVFSGVGHTFGADTKKTEVPITRKIPGIGIVESERYLSDHHQKSDFTQSGHVDLEKDASSRKGLDGDSVCKGNSSDVLNYESEESDFDELLDALLKPDFKKKKKKSVKPGFVSVCHKHSVADTALLKGSAKQRSPNHVNRERSRFFTKTTSHSGPGHSNTMSGTSEIKPNRTNRMVSRKKTNSKSDVKKAWYNDDNTTYSSSKQIPKTEPTDGFAMDRNKRVLDTHSSDSDSDIDENMTLGSVIRKARSPAAHITKKLKLSSDLPFTSPSYHTDVDLTAYPVVKEEPQMPEEDDVAFLNCPVCHARVKDIYINEHLDSCLS